MTKPVSPEDSAEETITPPRHHANRRGLWILAAVLIAVDGVLLYEVFLKYFARGIYEIH